MESRILLHFAMRNYVLSESCKYLSNRLKNRFQIMVIRFAEKLIIFTN